MLCKNTMKTWALLCRTPCRMQTKFNGSHLGFSLTRRWCIFFGSIWNSNLFELFDKTVLLKNRNESSNIFYMIKSSADTDLILTFLHFDYCKSHLLHVISANSKFRLELMMLTSIRTSHKKKIVREHHTAWIKTCQWVKSHMSNRIWYLSAFQTDIV